MKRSISHPNFGKLTPLLQALQSAGGWTPELRRRFLRYVRDARVSDLAFLELFVAQTSRDEVLATGLVLPGDAWPPKELSLEGVATLIQKNEPRPAEDEELGMQFAEEGYYA